ncbi:MAG: hypothetical protein ACOX57_00815 [Limnochordia bacterium]
MNKLELFLERLARDQVLFSSVEEAVRQAAVLPILSYLGWDTYNIMEVTPEYRVESGRVDYCLQYGTRKAAYIEVKRTLEDLEQHQKQLLEYAFTDGVELAALTNGHLWWLYLPLSGANWQQRRFFTIDIREQAPGDAAAHFRDFLSKETVGNGSALQRARTIHAGREKKRRVRDTIPKAWASLLLDSDEELLELLANKVEGMCGYRPEQKQLADFLSDFALESGKTEDTSETENAVGASTGQSVTEGKRKRISRNEQAKSQRQKGVRVRIGSTVISANSVSDLCYRAIKFVCDRGLDAHLDRLLPYATSNQRYLVARDPHHQRGNGFVSPVEYKGYYIETNQSYKNATKQLHELLNKLGLKLEVMD